MAALQETIWLGSEVYTVGESMVLTANRLILGVGHVKQRGEGVVIVITGLAVDAWEAGGKRWKGWSSRLITTILKLEVGDMITEM